MSYPNELKTGGYIMNAINCNADTNSDVLVIERAKHVSFDVIMNNTDYEGTIKYMVCNDLTPTNPNWNEVANTAVASGVNVADVTDFVDIGAKYMKVFMDRTSGSGVTTIVAHVKA